MTPQHQVNSFQKQALLKRNNTCSDAERKKSFTSARLSEIQEKTHAMQGQQIINMQTIPVQEISQSRPFTETHLGRIAPELRILIYHELVASPPTHAGQELTTQASRLEKRGPAAPKPTFVHLHVSCLAILATCRQIYIEACPVFYARTSYYAAHAKELEQLISLTSSSVAHSPLRTNMNTCLCVKDVAHYRDRPYELLCSPLLDAMNTRLRHWESLRKIYLCMRAGEELDFIKFLFQLPNMEYGVVEFLDDSRWVIRLQRPEEDWKIQYACFCCGNKTGEGGVKLDQNDIRLQRRLLEIESRDPGLVEGQERFVEVNIDAPLEKCMPGPMLEMMDKFSDLSVASDSRASSSRVAWQARVEEMAARGYAE